MSKQTIKLAKIRIDGGTQPRSKIDTDAVQDYAERKKAGDAFPAPEVFFDGTDYWLADGFHRYHADAANEVKAVECNVRNGTVRDAILFACSANGHHGLRRTAADKRKAVNTLLKDEEWGKRTDRWIAEQCCVSPDLVATCRKESDIASDIRKTRDGKQISTANRGRPRTTDEKDEPRAAAVKSEIPKTEPAADPEPETDPEPTGGYEPEEARKPLIKLAELIGKTSRAYADVEQILGKSVELRAVFAGIDHASIALTKFRAKFSKRAK